VIVVNTQIALAVNAANLGGSQVAGAMAGSGVGVSLS
jgi:hypothetical protein